MSKTISALSWAPYQAGGTGTLIATVDLDSANDTDYLVAINGQYSNQGVYADGVIIDNTGNNGFVNFKSGPLRTNIVPFGRDAVLLDKNINSQIEVTFNTGTIQLVFYRGKPPISAQVLNQAGAAAVSNTVVFNGGNTGGDPNSSTLSVASNYAFQNGVIVTGTIGNDGGFVNTGPATISINGGPNVSIKKPSPFGPIALTGGELVKTQNFVLVADSAIGAFVLLSAFSQPIGAQVLFNGTTGTIISSFNVSGVTRDAVGVYTVTFAVAFNSANYSIAAAAGNNNNTFYVASGYVSTSFPPTAASCRIIVSTLPGVLTDASNVSVIIAGG